MLDSSSSVSEVATARRSGSRIVAYGIAGIVAVLAVTGALLLLTLPDANAFNVHPLTLPRLALTLNFMKLKTASCGAQRP